MSLAPICMAPPSGAMDRVGRSDLEIGESARLRGRELTLPGQPVMMRFVVRLMRPVTVFLLTFLLAFSFWCGGLVGDASAMPVGMGAKPAPDCMDRSMPSGHDSRQDSALPCLFRSPDLFSQTTPRSLPAQDLFQHGCVATALSYGSSEQSAVTARSRVAARSLADKISPHLFFSVLNL